MTSSEENNYISGKHSVANLEYNAKVYEKYLRYLGLSDPGMILNIGFISFPELFEVLLPRLPQDYEDFVVCDASQKVVELAKNSQKNNRVKFIQLDIEDVNGPPKEWRGKFDHLFSSYTLGILSDLRQALKNSYELLRTDGDLLFLFAKYDPAFCTYEKMAKNSIWLPYLEKYKDYSSTVENEIGTKEKIIKWFETLRLKILAVAIDPDVSCQYSMKDLTGIADFLDIAQDQIPKEKLESYKTEYHQQFLATEAVSQHVENGEDVWKLKVPTVIVVAKK
ncbi:hypothetical protein HHI36_012414 [Cryptolaemus montrouzieri]|uniref:Methyltransferase type 11 domain-containing protein n=1 Tax=Cryptolaemus montrouzieri TaxID=559131 RepID=A0ABD2NE59_9CUCU